MHPYAVLSLVSTNLGDPLGAGYGPFAEAGIAAAKLDVSPEEFQKRVRAYQTYRDRPPPEIPDHPVASPSAVHVAFLDSGVDFVKNPELGSYLGLGRKGELSSYDFSDERPSPWVPSEQTLGHGTQVMTALIDEIGGESPELLTEHHLDLSMWKINSVRELLSGAYQTWGWSWGNGSIAVALAIRFARRLNSAQARPAPVL